MATPDEVVIRTRAESLPGWTVPSGWVSFAEAGPVRSHAVRSNASAAAVTILRFIRVTLGSIILLLNLFYIRYLQRLKHS